MRCPARGGIARTAVPCCESGSVGKSKSDSSSKFDRGTRNARLHTYFETLLQRQVMLTDTKREFISAEVNCHWKQERYVTTALGRLAS